MRKLIICASLVVLSLGGWSSCLLDEEIDSGNDNRFVICPMDTSMAQVVKNTNVMAFDFFREVNARTGENENFMISPLSLAQMLGMLANGAHGLTQEELLRAMGYVSQRDLNFTMRTLNDYLPTADKKTKVSLANSIWVDEGLDVHDSFRQQMQENYDAETFTQKLSTQQTMQAINDWCDKKTEGCIKDIIDKPLSEDCRMVLMNALYFKGEWAKKFDKSKTEPDTFRCADGHKTKVMMMRDDRRVKLCNEESFMMAELPYGNEAYLMDIILPNEGERLADCLAELTPTRWNKLLERMYMQSVYMMMPRMELEYKIDLNEVLEVMGIHLALDGYNADFSAMSDHGLYLEKADQVTYIKVDEEGTQAAAVTKGEMGDLMAPGPGLEFRLDRPFAYVIRMNGDGPILFMGVVNGL